MMQHCHSMVNANYPALLVLCLLLRSFAVNSCRVQIASTLIAAFGFGGYPLPPGGIYDCSLCANSQGWHPQFWPRGFVPVAGSEGRFVASVIGCTYYVVVAWIWWVKCVGCVTYCG